LLGEHRIACHEYAARDANSEKRSASDFFIANRHFARLHRFFLSNVFNEHRGDAQRYLSNWRVLAPDASLRRLISR